MAKKIDLFWHVLAVPFVLLGCMSGWFYEAFMEGVQQGRSDWKEEA